MFRSYRLGRLFGFPIDINMSFIVLLGVVALWMGGLAGVFAVLVAFGSVLLHELGHALVARHLGVRIAGIELYFFGGAAKMLDQPKSAGDEIAIAAAGPAVSFALGGLGLVLYSLLGGAFLQLFAWVNLVIGAFNMIPALPMDGGRILRAGLSFKHGFRNATHLAMKVARVFAVLFGIVGLAFGSFQLAILAVVIWFMGSAEMRAANITGGYGGGRVVMPGSYTGWGNATRTSGWQPPRGRGHYHHDGVEVMSGPPPDPRRGHGFVGGFTIRQRGGRLYIEYL